MSDEYDILIELSADDVSRAANEKDKRDAEITRLRAENQRLRLLINEYLTSLERITNEWLREIWAKENKK